MEKYYHFLFAFLLIAVTTIKGQSVYGDVGGENLVNTLCPDNNHPHIINLGEAGMWACCNVGASSPEQYGMCYAWGETEDNSSYTLDNYKWNDGGKGCTFTKYCTNESNGIVDDKTELEPSDDVAHVKWGNQWRMPTKEELQNLMNKCSSEWTTYNGVYGRIFMGSNGNKIFMPAAGYYDKSGLRERTEYGYYWTKSLSLDSNEDAYHLYFCCGCGIYFSSYGARKDGLSIRPVAEENGKETAIIESSKVSSRSEYYTLQGQRVEKLGKGLYIFNGKAIIAK